MRKYLIVGVLTLALSACSVPFMDSGKKSQSPPSSLGTTSPEQMKILKDPQKIATEKQNIRIQMVESLKKQGGDTSKFGTGVLDLNALTDQEFQSLYQTAFNPLDRDRRQKLVDFYKTQWLDISGFTDEVLSDGKKFETLRQQTEKLLIKKNPI